MGVLVGVLLGVALGLLAQGSPSRVRAGELEKKRELPMELPFNLPIYSTCFISQQERLMLALQGRVQDLPQHR